MRRIELILICENKTTLRQLIRDFGGRTSINCAKCGGDAKLDLLSLRFKCRKQVDYERCSFSKAFFDEQHSFHFTKLSLKKIIYILYEFGVTTPVDKTAFELDLHPSTISRTYQIFREKLNLIYLMNEPDQIGGADVIVEWDESLMVKNKNFDGRILSGQKWLFGGVERGNTKNCFIEYVARRDTETLAEVIKRRIKPGSIIMCDMWPAYNGINALLPGYNLRLNQVNHSTDWVNPLTGAHTQSIEGFWSVIKRKKRFYGTNTGSFEDSLEIIQEIITRRVYGNEIFEMLLEELFN